MESTSGDQSGTGTPETQQNREADTNPPLSSKDRACPFCRQIFTSSSLGRHLDVYIRDKNPKGPDGVHDVDAIRKMRAGITRRHARGSQPTAQEQIQNDVKSEPGGKNLKRARSQTISPSPSPPPSLYRPPQQVPAVSPPKYNATETEDVVQDYRSIPNRPDWRATGVINDIPPRVSSLSNHESGTNRQEQRRIDRDRGQPHMEDQDSGYAAELALREVLRIVQAATVRTQVQPLFDFQFFSCNFPALCLRLLPVPAALFSSTPLGTSGSWPLTVPDENTFEEVQHELQKRLNDRWHDLHYTINGVDLHCRKADTNPVSVPELQRYTTHLQTVYQDWTSMASVAQADIYKLELMRAYASSMAAHASTKNTLEIARREIGHMRYDLETLGRKRAQGNEPSSPEPDAPPPLNLGLYELPNEVVKEVARSSDTMQGWDYDKLIARWKSVSQGHSVKSQARRGGRARAAPSGAASDSHAGYAPSAVGMAGVQRDCEPGTPTKGISGRGTQLPANPGYPQIPFLQQSSTTSSIGTAASSSGDPKHGQIDNGTSHDAVGGIAKHSYRDQQGHEMQRVSATRQWPAEFEAG